MTESQQLLAEYAKTGSEPAFRELVARYIDLVYSAALRLVDGDTHRAEDVTQTVFAGLARKAPALSEEVMVGGWLHRHTCHVAATMMRSERRRQAREKEAAEMNAMTDHSEANLQRVAPIIDEAINQLGADDRTAIMLRFFEQRDLRSVGAALGSNEDAAQKRVARALEKLQALLRNRGVTFSAAALGTALAVEAVSAAPAGLAVSVAGMAMTGTASGGLSLFKALTLSKLKPGLVAAIVTAGMMTPIVLQHRTTIRLREEIVPLRQQAVELDRLQAENQRLSNLLAQAKSGQSRSNSQLSELLRLRSEVVQLREQKQDLEKQRLASGPQAAKPAAAPDKKYNFPKESWKNAGRATPEDALQTLYWGQLHRDLKTVRETYTPATWDSILQYIRDHPTEYNAKTADEVDLSKAIENRFNDVTGFHIQRKDQISEDYVELEVVLDGRPRVSLTGLKKIGGEWKIGQGDD